MNGSPALTIFFFQLRRTRWLLLSIAGCLVVVSGALYLIDQNGLRSSAGETSQDFIITLLFIGVSVGA